MNPNTDQPICPVCHMRVDAPDFDYDYLNISYWFCSEQCKQRFMANPGLYVGKPGEKSPKQQGKTILKKRRIYLDKPMSHESKATLFLVLTKMMGIKSVTQSNNGIVIEYDLLQVTAKQIASALLNAGLELDDSMMQRIKLSLIDVAEETQIASMEVSHDGKPSGGCH